MLRQAFTLPISDKNEEIVFTTHATYNDWSIVTKTSTAKEYKATTFIQSERSDADLTTYCSTQAVVRPTEIIPPPSPTPAANNYRAMRGFSEMQITLDYNLVRPCKFAGQRKHYLLGTLALYVKHEPL